jgi:plastocyanin
MEAPTFDPKRTNMRRLLAIALLAFVSTAANAQPVVVKLSEWKVDLSRDTVKAGRVTFQITNEGSMLHALHIRGDSVDKGAREMQKREAGNLVVTLKPGTYEVFCPLADNSHKLAGMTRKLVVVAATPAPAKKP